MPVSDNRALILCVDDEEVALYCRRAILEGAGYKVLTALDGETGFTLFQQNHIDLVITDHLLPGANGCEMAAKMKAVSPLIPIVLLSGLAESPDTRGVIDLFIMKGSPIPDFLNQIASILKQTRPLAG